MERSKLWACFHDIKERYDNVSLDPEVQRVDYQIMVADALTVLKQVIDTGLNDEQLRHEAYHNGYEQGRFDEYADRMGREQAEKVKRELEKQENGNNEIN